MTGVVTPDTANLAPVHPLDLVAEAEIDDAAPDRVTVDATFRLATEGEELGALHVDIGDGMVASEFSVDGVTHVLVQQLDGEEPVVWFSPEIEADPDLMRGYWGVMSDLRLYEDGVTEGNPLCGATKWGLRGLTWLAVGGCCAATKVCAICVAGGKTADGHIRDIDCSKNCKPDCPIP